MTLRAGLAFGGLAAIMTMLCLSPLVQRRESSSEPDRPRPNSSVTNPDPGRPAIAWFPRGTDTAASSYYVESAMALGIPGGTYSNPAAAYEAWVIGDFLRYMGFSGFPFRASPCDQMAVAGKRDEVLALRYFAPKTSSVGRDGHATELGWRQIIWLRARLGSTAAGVGIESAFVLLNFQQPAGDVAKDPFARPPLYTQVMLVSTDPVRRPTRWLVFGQDQTRANGIKATFEGGDVASGGQTLHLPDACAQCHGGDERLPHLNLLDIDNWSDRASEGDTFGIVSSRALVGLTPMGHCTTRPIDVVRKLNQEIQRHNDLEGLRTPAFVREAVASWNAKHQRVDAVAMADRSFGKTRWVSLLRKDKELLGMLNRYCYRCHGTIRFDIYNRSQVVTMADRAIRQINLGLMPLDRQRDRLLPDAERQKLVQLLDDLK